MTSGASQGPHEQGLAEPWQAFEQDMTARQDRDQQLGDQRTLADDLRIQLPLQGGDLAHQLRRPMFDAVLVHHAPLATPRRSGGDIRDSSTSGVCPTSQVMSAAIRAIAEA